MCFDTSMWGALLDYTKLFDLFDHDFMFALLEEMGVPRRPVEAAQALVQPSDMYMKVGQCFGQPWEDCNGLGQG